MNYHFPQVDFLSRRALAVSGIASAQDKKDDQDKKEEIAFNLVQNPTTPAAITPPAGHSASGRWSRPQSGTWPQPRPR